MIRILLIVLVFAMVVAFLYGKRSGVKTKSRENSKLPVTKIVKCTLCELHVAQEDALEIEGHFFCSIEHSRKFEQESR